MARVALSQVLEISLITIASTPFATGSTEQLDSIANKVQLVYKLFSLIWQAKPAALHIIIISF